MLKKPWRPEWVLLFCVAQMICIALGVVVVTLLHKAGLRGFENEEGIGNIVVATMGFQGATLVLTFFFLKAHGVGWDELLRWRKPDLLRDLGLAVAALVVILPVALVLENVSKLVMDWMGLQPKVQTAVDLLAKAPWWPTGIYLAFFAVILAPVAEEIVFRGILYPLIKQAGYPRTAWFWVSFLFALIHGTTLIFVPLLALALALTWLYEKTDNLLAPITAHSLFNAVNLALFYLGKGSGGI